MAPGAFPSDHHEEEAKDSAKIKENEKMAIQRVA
jgi:hypothetical protein